MRIATSQLYTSSVQTMEDQQSQLLQIQEQISSGIALNTAGDNPVAAAQAVKLSATSATLTQYQANQNTALTSLQLEDNTLSTVTTTLQSVSNILEQAGNGSLNDQDRSALAQQLQGLRNQLLSLANTTNGTGQYLFAGFQASTPPFSNASAGGVQYSGDQGQLLAQVSSNRQISSSDTGSSVFMSVQAVGSDPVPAGSSSNTGTGTIGAVTVSDPSAASNNVPYSIVFSNASGSLTYDVLDNSTSPATTVSSNQPYTAGQPISLGSGMSVAVSGTPASGDSFTVTQANQAGTDIFATIDSAIAALQTPTQSLPTAEATLTNAMSTAMTKVNNALGNVTTIHASVGGREQELKALQTVTSSNTLQVQTSLSDLTSTDMTSAISQYEQLSNALTASQKSFVSMQGLSLFQYINP
ncbi:MAG TPA: flagellar hook-associated protein FlgL [Paraburkholderia sp.]|jgi:flagellar hook-associated protein 3 FlgL|nr:flagellar hook-associated protein FlgL [Paraburkholderia sp.]